MIEKKRDFHIHATYHRFGDRKSDMTVEKVLDQCKTLGLYMVGVGEHLDRSSKHPESCIRNLVNEFKSLNPPIDSYVFAEANVIDRVGTVTCSLDKKRDLGLDYLLGGFHTGAWNSTNQDVYAYIEEEYQRIVNMLKYSPQIDVVAHPWRAGMKWERNGSISKWSFELVPEDYQDKLIEEAYRRGKGIEINLKNTTLDEPYIRFVKKIRDSSVPLSIGSDAHKMDALGLSLDIIAFLNDVGVEDDDLWMP